MGRGTGERDQEAPGPEGEERVWLIIPEAPTPLPNTHALCLNADDEPQTSPRRVEHLSRCSLRCLGGCACCSCVVVAISIFALYCYATLVIPIVSFQKPPASMRQFDLGKVVPPTFQLSLELYLNFDNTGNWLGVTAEKARARVYYEAPSSQHSSVSGQQFYIGDGYLTKPVHIPSHGTANVTVWVDGTYETLTASAGSETAALFAALADNCKAAIVPGAGTPIRLKLGLYDMFARVLGFSIPVPDFDIPFTATDCSIT